MLIQRCLILRHVAQCSVIGRRFPNCQLKEYFGLTDLNAKEYESISQITLIDTNVRW